MAKKFRYPCAPHQLFIPLSISKPPCCSSTIPFSSSSSSSSSSCKFSQILLKTMSLALGSNGGVTIERSSFIHRVPSMSDRDFPEDDEESDASSSSSSSSIGANSVSSEDSSDREDSGETEVQSSFKGPLDTINDLEEDLPVKKGISRFYSGKSKSYTSLADAVSVTSVQEIVKPEDPYAKKRKNLLARNLLFNRSSSCSENLGGISKRKANIGRGASCLTLSSSSGSSEEGKSSTSISPPCPLPLPPLHPQGRKPSANAPQPLHPPARNTPLRSYSWSDLQSVEAHDMSSLAICSENKGNKVH